MITVANDGDMSKQTSIAVPEDENQFYYTGDRTPRNTWLAVVAPRGDTFDDENFTAVWLDRLDSRVTRFDQWQYNSLTKQNTIIHGRMSERGYDSIFTDPGLQPSQDYAGSLSLSQSQSLRLRLRLRPY